MRLLLVEDEWRLIEVISEGLSQVGFVVDALDTVRAAEQALGTVPYDALILDLGLPDGDGLNLLARLRQRQNTLPVLILTARDAVEDRVAGLDGGADDYLLKPFAMTELLARIKALLRRPGAALGTVLTAGNLAFDSIGREVAVAGQRLDLSRQELALLEQLLRRLGRVVPRAVLEKNCMATIPSRPRTRCRCTCIICADDWKQRALRSVSIRCAGLAICSLKRALLEIQPAFSTVPACLAAGCCVRAGSGRLGDQRFSRSARDHSLV